MILQQRKVKKRDSSKTPDICLLTLLDECSLMNKYTLFQVACNRGIGFINVSVASCISILLHADLKSIARWLF